MAALVFLVAYAIRIIHPDLPVGMAAACRTTSLLVWGLFATDLVVRVALAPRKGRYLLTNWLDVIAVALPVLRAVLALSILGRRGQPFVRGRMVGCVVAAVAGVCGVAALAVLDAEQRNPRMRTSRGSRTPCGGQSAQLRPWGTGTGSRPRLRVASWRWRSW